MKMKTPAKWIDCPGVVSDGRANHSMRDGCWSCAPWWERVAVCPVDEVKLTAKGFCRKCRKHFSTEREG